MGCNFEHEDDGSDYGYSTIITANGIGKIIFEVLDIVEMPRKYKNRVIYKFDRIDPDGKRTNSSKVYTATIDRFIEMTKRPYRADYIEL